MAKGRYIAWVLVALCCVTSARAQEVLVPAGHTPYVAPTQRGMVGTQKGTITSVTLPFFDDFSDYSGAPALTLWATMGGAYVGPAYGVLPPTVGVLTLDALDAEGRLYEHATTGPFAADTAMSLPISLNGLDSTDAVVMSFYYLPGGSGAHPWEIVGDTPDPGDSLFLDFYSVTDTSWHTIWSRGGISAAQLLEETGREWQYVAIPISDSCFLDSAFRFRFRNHCSLEDNGKTGMMGNVDQWNIDYVVIDQGREVDSVGVTRDIAFVEPAPTMLAHYRAMPARQYRTSDMAQQLHMTIANLYSSPIASYYSYRVEDSTGTELYTYDGGYQNAPAEGYQTAPVHARPSVEYAFEESTQQRSYTIVHNVREGASGDEWPQNDTVRFIQHFLDYYAYDDGTAENGYGLTSTAASVSLAYRFDLNTADTLSAVDMAFNRSFGGENEEIAFRLTVWSADNGVPGAVLYRDQASRHPIMPDQGGLAGERGAFHRYVLESSVVVNGSIFVGFVQEGNDFINLGFDRSFNTSDRIYHYTSDAWQQSYLSGSLMIRPCFGQSAIVGIKECSEHIDCKVYPNPADHEVCIDGLQTGCKVTLYDIRGRQVLTHSSNHFNTSTLPAGIYMLKAITPSGALHTAKIIIKH